MPSRIKHGLLISIAVISLFFVAVYSYAETTNYIYDNLNRLKRVEYGDGTIIEYNYDQAGNRTSIQHPAPPTRTITIDSGAAVANGTTVTLTLYCSDPIACSQMRFSNDNITYSAPEAFAPFRVWTLPSGDGIKTVYIKFGDSDGYWSNPFTDTITVCSSSSARIGSTSYATLQAAYEAAGDGNIIKCLGKRFIESLTVNRNIAVILEGGYDCGYTANSGGMTFDKGTITTTAGGGTITIKNFTLEK